MFGSQPKRPRHEYNTIDGSTIAARRKAEEARQAKAAGIAAVRAPDEDLRLVAWMKAEADGRNATARAKTRKTAGKSGGPRVAPLVFAGSVLLLFVLATAGLVSMGESAQEKGPVVQPQAAPSDGANPVRPVSGKPSEPVVQLEDEMDTKSGDSNGTGTMPISEAEKQAGQPVEPPPLTPESPPFAR